MPDSLGFFVLTLRPESLWVAGRPTLDAINAAIHTYVGSPRPAPSSLPDSLRVPPNLSATEFYSLMLALPTADEARDSTAIERLRRWVRANPSVRHRYPGSVALLGWPLATR